MKLARDTHVATGDGFGAVADFSIEMNDKAFTVLSDTIYKDKIGSIVRELSCNAFDAHIEAGKSDMPFDIHLPDAFEPYFSIRDYGNGISPEDIIRIYTKYFASTKDESNDVVGAFGLGSKTPFSYTDAFTVISIHDGVKTMYNAHKSAGLPAIVAYGDPKATDEANGLEVRVSVEAMDYGSFSSAVKRQLKFFPVKPNILNGSIKWETHTPILEVPGFLFYSINDETQERRYYYSREYVSGGLFIKQGPVGYPVDFDTLNQVMDSKGIKRSSFYEYLWARVSNSRDSRGTLIDMPIGTVEVTASREGISYKDTTVMNILSRLERISNKLGDEVITKLEASYAKGYVSFCKTFNALDSYFKKTLSVDELSKRFPKLKFQNRNVGIVCYLPGSAKVWEGVEFRKYSLRAHIKPKATYSHTFSADYIDPNNESLGKESSILINLDNFFGHSDNDGNTNVVYIKDVGTGFTLRLKEHNPDEAIMFILPDGVTKDDIVKELGDEFTVRNVTDLPVVKQTRKTKSGNGGFSITNGRRRLWFSLDTAQQLYEVINFDHTCYAVNCKQHFGEDFSEATDSKYAFFTTYNNKINAAEDNAEKTFSDNTSLVVLFTEWLREQGYTIVAVAGSAAGAAQDSGKFFCINELWKQQEQAFYDGIWNSFTTWAPNQYYDMLKKEYVMNQWNSARSAMKLCAMFDELSYTEHLDAKKKLEWLRDHDATSKATHLLRMDSAIRDIFADDPDKLKHYDAINKMLFNRGCGYNDKNTLEEVESVLIAAGIDLKVVGSEVVDCCIDIIKNNVDELIIHQIAKHEKFQVHDFTISEPFSDAMRFSDEDFFQALKNKT